MKKLIIREVVETMLDVRAYSERLRRVTDRYASDTALSHRAHSVVKVHDLVEIELEDEADGKSHVGAIYTKSLTHFSIVSIDADSELGFDEFEFSYEQIKSIELLYRPGTAMLAAMPDETIELKGFPIEATDEFCPSATAGEDERGPIDRGELG